MSSRMRMPLQVRVAYREERRAAAEAVREREIAVAWQHLERAHVLAQPFAVAHVGSHVAQLALGARTRDGREIVGQLVRVAVSGPASLTGKVPVGNRGRASMPLRATAPVPEDLASVLATAA